MQTIRFFTTRRTLIVLLSMIPLAIGLFTSACSDREKEEEIAFDPLSHEALVARGKYLMTVGVCHDCHSPKIMTPHGPEPDPERYFSGHPRDEKIPPTDSNPGWILFSDGLTAIAGPWGVAFAANLTPHETGTGNWTFEQFKTAIRKGKYKGHEGGRDLLPPMPWQMYRNFTDNDLRAIFAYLRTVKPVNNLVPTPLPPAS